LVALVGEVGLGFLPVKKIIDLDGEVGEVILLVALVEEVDFLTV